MKGFMFGVLLTIFLVGGGGFYLYETKFKQEPQAAGPAIVIQTAPAPASVPASSEPTPAPAEVAAAPAAPAAPPTTAAPAIARADSDGVAGISLGVTELKRTSGDTVTLKFTITNSGNATDYYMSDGVPRDITLVDAVNKKKYLVVKDSDGKCLCTNQSTEYIKPGMQASIWAKFPAPPSDVTKISVVVPTYVPMDDVPISQ